MENITQLYRSVWRETNEKILTNIFYSKNLIEIIMGVRTTGKNFVIEELLWEECIENNKLFNWWVLSNDELKYFNLKKWKENHPENKYIHDISYNASTKEIFYKDQLIGYVRYLLNYGALKKERNNSIKYNVIDEYNKFPKLHKKTIYTAFATIRGTFTNSKWFLLGNTDETPFNAFTMGLNINVINSGENNYQKGVRLWLFTLERKDADIIFAENDNYAIDIDTPYGQAAYLGKFIYDFEDIKELKNVKKHDLIIYKTSFKELLTFTYSGNNIYWYEYQGGIKNKRVYTYDRIIKNVQTLDIHHKYEILNKYINGKMIFETFKIKEMFLDLLNLKE